MNLYDDVNHINIKMDRTDPIKDSLLTYGNISGEKLTAKDFTNSKPYNHKQKGPITISFVIKDSHKWSNNSSNQ